MIDFFVSYSAEDAAYSLTKAGTIILIILALLLLCVVAFLTGKKTHFSAKRLAFSAMGIALAFLLSYVELFHMPWGGSITLCSMLFVTVIGYWYGPAVGFTAAFSYGLLQFVQSGGSYMLSLTQVLMDYIFAFTALGAAGFFANKKHGLRIGYIVAILLRGVFASIAGYMFWMDYMPENFPASLAGIYPIAYNYAYILAEGALTLIVLSIPAVQNAMKQVKNMATS